MLDHWSCQRAAGVSILKHSQTGSGLQQALTGVPAQRSCSSRRSRGLVSTTSLVPTQTDGKVSESSSSNTEEEEAGPRGPAPGGVPGHRRR